MGINLSGTEAHTLHAVGRRPARLSERTAGRKGADGMERSLAPLLEGRYREIILYKVYADLRSESERTYVGYLWWIIEPVIQMAIYYAVFEFILVRRTEDFVSFLLVGVVVWRWFQQTLIEGASSILAAQALINEVYLPKLILPTVSVLCNTLKFSLVLLLLLTFLWFRGYGVTGAYLALPVILLTQFCLIVACTYVLAPLVPFFPDLRVILNSFLIATMFLSGVFYSISSIPESVRYYFYLNPMAVILEAYRAVLLHAAWPAWELLGVIAIVSVCALLTGAKLTARLSHVFPKL